MRIGNHAQIIMDTQRRSKDLPGDLPTIKAYRLHCTLEEDDREKTVRYTAKSNTL